jgi:hypothetical protein
METKTKHGNLDDDVEDDDDDNNSNSLHIGQFDGRGMGELTYAHMHKIFKSENPKGRKYLRDLDVDGRALKRS